MLRHLLILLFSLLVAEANEALELARIHVEAIGGRQRIDALQSLRATARVSIGNQSLELLILAERPNRIRTEAYSGEQLLIQAYDGINPPWQFRRKAAQPHKQPLSPASAEAFVADADFLDPLADWVARGRSLEFVGRVLGYGTLVNRIRIATTGRDLIEVWLDPKTYLITHQLRQRRVSEDRTVVLETHYSDFRPVAGVIMPHRMATYAEGRLLHVTELLRVSANPVLPANCFVEP